MFLHMLLRFLWFIGHLIPSFLLKNVKNMKIYISFLVAVFSLNFTKLLQSHIVTYMLYDSWNSCIASYLPSASSKVAVESKKYKF